MDMGEPHNSPADDAKRSADEGTTGGKQPPALPPVQPGIEERIEEISRKARENTANDEAEQQRQRSLEKAAKWQARAAVSIVILTGAQIFVSWLQWTSSEKQVELDRINHQPVLAVAEVKVENLEAGKFPTVTIVIRNFGNTPATIMTASFNSEIHTQDEGLLATDSRAEARMGSVVFSGRVVPANTTAPAKISKLPLVTDELLKELGAKTKWIAITGYVHYIDPLGAGTEADYSAVYDVNRKLIDEHTAYFSLNREDPEGQHP